MENTDFDNMLNKLDHNCNDITMTINKIKNELETLFPDMFSEQISNMNESCDEINTQENYMEQLNNLIGLEEVKKEIQKLINYLIYRKKVKDIASFDSLNLNMIFKGNPGTGKTTVARIISKILYKMGYLSTENVVETTPKDFIAGYVGQTALKAQKLIEKYKGGVIFIDEAYTFTNGKDESNTNFAPEAITEIIKEMEKKETVFIFAGYEKEMEDFINLNPGIYSRIGYHLSFEDYSEKELLNMYINKLHKSGLKIEDSALEKIQKIIVAKKNEKNFGNGRMIDNLFDQIILEHATLNIEENDNNKLMTITKETIENLKLKQKRGKYFG